MNSTESLQKHYTEIKKLYELIFKTYEEQREAFIKEDEDRVQVIIDQRSNLMGEVDKTTELIIQGKKEIGEESSLSKEIKELTLSIKDIIEKTINFDQKLTEEMQIALGENRQKRQGLQQGKKVFNAYNQNNASALFIDKKK